LPVIVSCERSQFADERWIVFDEQPNAIGIRDAALIASAQQLPDPIPVGPFGCHGENGNLALSSSSDLT